MHLRYQIHRFPCGSLRIDASGKLREVSDALVLASTPKRTHAEVGEQNSEKSGNHGTPGSNLARHVDMILAPASDAADQSEPEEQESSDLQPKNPADLPQRLQKSANSRRNSLKNPPALLPLLKRPGHFAQHGTDRARRWRLCSQRIRKTAHKRILDQFRESCIPESSCQTPQTVIAGNLSSRNWSRRPAKSVLEKAQNFHAGRGIQYTSDSKRVRAAEYGGGLKRSLPGFRATAIEIDSKSGIQSGAAATKTDEGTRPSDQ
jgi:hypothetical protein